MQQNIHISADLYPLQVVFQDYSRTFQACLCQPITTQPEALSVDWHHHRICVHLNTKAKALIEQLSNI